MCYQYPSEGVTLYYAFYYQRMCYQYPSEEVSPLLDVFYYRCMCYQYPSEEVSTNIVALLFL